MRDYKVNYQTIRNCKQVPGLGVFRIRFEFEKFEIRLNSIRFSSIRIRLLGIRIRFDSNSNKIIELESNTNSQF